MFKDSTYCAECQEFWGVSQHLFALQRILARRFLQARGRKWLALERHRWMSSKVYKFIFDGVTDMWLLALLWMMQHVIGT